MPSPAGADADPEAIAREASVGRHRRAYVYLCIWRLLMRFSVENLL